MKILCIGDIVGKPGRLAVEALLPGLKKEFAIDFVIANGENSAGGFGITERMANQLFAAGCDVITLGDHTWDQMDVAQYLNRNSNIIRPANFPPGTAGEGWTIVKSASGKKVAVINMLGRVFMRHQVDCPFRTMKEIVSKLRKETPIIVVDMHAETTSEKVAMGFFMDGEVSAIFGTHTHIQTADEKILPQQTAYITDLGMTGPYLSVIGQNKEKIIERFLTSMPIRFEVAEADVNLSGVVIDVDENTGRARSINRVFRKYNGQIGNSEKEEN